MYVHRKNGLSLIFRWGKKSGAMVENLRKCLVCGLIIELCVFFFLSFFLSLKKKRT